MSARELFSSVLRQALAEIRKETIPVYTFALYHDHESATVSVCVDTQESSAKLVASSNAHSMRYFAEAIAEKDLKAASLWQANIGRSLSLGDFALVNSARTELGKVKPNKDFYLNMVEAIIQAQSEIVALAPNPEQLLFACSGPNDKVAYVWAMVPPNPAINPDALKRAGYLDR
jgi:hypothetical protein